MKLSKATKKLLGDGFLTPLSQYLIREFPDIKGFSLRNLKYIRQWVKFWQFENTIGQQTVAQLFQIPWGHNFPSTFNLLAQLLKTDGVFYCSFKYGDKDTSREQSKDGRSFTNCDESRLKVFIKDSGLSISQTWQSQDCRPGRKNELWLNAILHKTSK